MTNGIEESQFQTDGLDETRLEFGDLDQTLLEAAHAAPVTISRVEGAPVTTIRVECDPNDQDTPLSELVAHIFFEINRLNLTNEPRVHVMGERSGTPLGVSCAVMAHLAAIFDEVKVYCHASQTFETVSV